MLDLDRSTVLPGAGCVDSCRSPQQDGRRCCLCGGTTFRLLHSWEVGHPRNGASIPLSVWQCRCELVLLHPLPTPNQLPEDGDWWSSQRKLLMRNPVFKRIRQRVKNFIFGSGYQRLVRQTRRAGASGRLLDIGCGNGDLLQQARPFFDCEGVEPSAKAAAVTRGRGFRVREGQFEDLRFPAASYDVVTMNAVLEHVVDPVDVLEKVNHLLRPDGVVAVKVPKLWGPSHRRHGREWNGFRVGYHTVMFTGKTLGAVFHATGFQTLVWPRRDRPLDDILLLWGVKRRGVLGVSRAEAA